MPNIFRSSIADGLSEEEINHTEAELNVTLPDDFRLSYRIHNGQTQGSAGYEPQQHVGKTLNSQ